MKRFVFAVVFCSSLLMGMLYLTSPSTEASGNVLNDLLNLPSPPPPNPLMRDQDQLRPEAFYDEYTPPADDAPIEDLLDYWQRQSGSHRSFGYNAKPSEAVMQRLLKVCEKEPQRLFDFINAFPPNAAIAEKVKYFYDEELDHKRLGEEWQEQIRNWLTNHSTYFLDRLVKKARAAREDREYVTNQDDLLNLAEIDWDSAQPIVDKLLEASNQPVSNTLATWCLYRRAIEKGETTDIDKYREQLKAVVEDKTAGGGKRDLAFDALIREGDWEGRDEWYLSLMKDETLGDLRVNGQNYTGLTTVMLYAPAAKYKDRMLELLRSDNVHVRTAAIRNLVTLITAKDPDVIKALLPWLSDKNWAREVQGERNTLVSALRDLQMPESVPGLIAVLNERESAAPESAANRALYDGANTNTFYAMNKAMNTAANVMRMTNTSNAVYSGAGGYPYRESAIYALSAQKDIRVVPVLRAVLPQVTDYMRGDVIRGIWNANGFSIPEQLSALETTVRNADRPQDTTAGLINGPYRGLADYEKLQGPFSPSMVPLLLGNMLSNESTVSDELVMATINRVEVLQRSEPRVALALKKTLFHWRGPAMNIFAVRELRKGTANIDIVIRVLSEREELREKLPGEVAELHNANPFARGIGACILDDRDNYDSVFSTGDAVTKTTLLGCARMVRAPLPLQKVEAELKSPDKVLALAAQHYLESEDSPAARGILLSHFPNAMKIYGARTTFRVTNAEPDFDQQEMSTLFSSVAVPGFDNPGYVPLEEGVWEKQEKSLKKEFDDDKDLLGLYFYDDNYIQIYGDHVVFRWSEDEARYRERSLKKEEFEAFTTFLRNGNVDSMPPFLSSCEYCDESQLVMLGRAGGRRVFFRSSETVKLQNDLDAIFAELRKVPAKLHYRMEKYLPGLEILFEDENLAARSVWKNSDDLRLLIENAAVKEKAEEEMRKSYRAIGEEMEDGPAVTVDVPTRLVSTALEKVAQIKKDMLRWHKFSNGILGDVALPPPGIDMPIDMDDGVVAVTMAQSSSWKSRTAAIDVRASFEGLFKTSGGATVKIKEGRYASPVVTPNGRWAVVTKYIDYQPELVRINLTTNKEFPVNLSEGMQRAAIVFVPSLNRVLIANYNYYYNGEGEEGGGEGEVAEGPSTESKDVRYFLLDAETGTMIEVRNEVAPLEQQSVRPLQPVTGKPDTFWAAIPNGPKKNTRFGFYNARRLLFTPLQTIPEIQFDSMDAWIDEAEGKVYVVYKGQLLRIPLPKPGAPGAR